MNKGGCGKAEFPITPRPLQPGDKLSVVAPAGSVSREQLEAGLTVLSGRYQVCWDEDLLCPDGYFAGTDQRRLAELQAALDDRETAAVIAVRGGFGTSRILDRLRLDHLRDSPKWFVGSSDLTTLHLALWTGCRIRSIHGPMVAGLGGKYAAEFARIVDLLEGKSQPATLDLETVSPGLAEGPLIGGNLTVLAHLMGSLAPNCSEGAILFLEDVGEAPYRLERCLVQLVRGGMFSGAVGVILGNFSECDPRADGVTPAQAITRALAGLEIPVAAGYPAAHGVLNRSFIHGTTVVLDARGDGAALHF